MIFIVFDTETTGLQKLSGLLSKPTSVTKMGSEVIQIGGLMFDEYLRPIKGFCHYCDCLAPHSSSGAFSTHGIMLEDIRTSLSGIFLEEILATWLPEFYGDNVIFVGYNILFDLSMVAQSVRDFPVHFKSPKQILGRMPRSGRYYLDVLTYIGPYKMKLVQAKKMVDAELEEFLSIYEMILPIDSNRQDLYRESWSHSHNALYDALVTYLLFKKKVWDVGILGGGRRGQ